MLPTTMSEHVGTQHTAGLDVQGGGVVNRKPFISARLPQLQPQPPPPLSSRSSANNNNDDDVQTRTTGTGKDGGDAQVDLIHMRVRHNGCIAYKTSTVAGVIIVTEFCERLAYYGLGGSLVLFFQTRLDMSNAAADMNYSAWSGICYVTPLLGGYIADSYLGRYNTILVFATIYLFGLCLITIAAAPDYTYHGLVILALYIIALGTGGIKPNVSTLGADQFDDRIEEEKDAKASFFSWFYFSINCGAAIAYTVVSYICQYGAGKAAGGVEWGFFYGFMIPTISMLVGVIAFVAGKHVFGYAGSGRVSKHLTDSPFEDSSHSDSSDSNNSNSSSSPTFASSNGSNGGKSRVNRRGSTNPIHNPAAAGRILPFRPDEIRKEINKERLRNQQEKRDRAEMARQEAISGDISPRGLRVMGGGSGDTDTSIGMPAEAEDSFDVEGNISHHSSFSSAAGGGGNSLESAWNDPSNSWDENHTPQFEDTEEHPHYDDETLAKWHQEFTSQDSELGLASNNYNSRSEVSILFSVLMQGFILYTKAKIGMGRGKFKIAKTSSSSSSSSSAVIEGGGGTDLGVGIAMTDLNSGTNTSTSAEGRPSNIRMDDIYEINEDFEPSNARTLSGRSDSVSAFSPQLDCEVHIHVLDYACLDNYPKSKGMNMEHATLDELKYGISGKVPDQGHYSRKQVKSAKLVTRLLPFLGVFVMFWTIYSQMSVGFQNQGCQMDLRLSSDSINGVKLPISALNLFDTLAILIIVPILDKLVYPWMKTKYGAAPPLLTRIQSGFLLTVFAMIVAGIVEHVRKQYLPVYDYASGQGYYNDPNALANASPCANIDEFNPAYYGAWWQFQHSRKIYDKLLANSAYVTIDGFKLFDDSLAPAYCHSTCEDTWFGQPNVEANNPYSTLHLNSTCITCDPIPQVSSVSVLWQIPQFCLIGAAEVLASVSSMEFFYSQAPPQFRSVVQSFNLASVACGSLLVIPLILIVNSGGGDKAATDPSNPSSASGIWVPADLNYGHLDMFFYLLALLMVCNCVVLRYISKGYVYQTDASLALALK